MAEIVSLYENSWISLREVRDPDNGVNGYVFSHESNCQGRKIAILPFRYNYQTGMADFLVKLEVTPCWDMEPVLSAITGGYEGDDIIDDAVKEMLEETGFTVTREELIPLGVCYASKSSDTVYNLYSVDLTGKVASTIVGDGSRLKAIAAWVTLDDLVYIQDAQLGTMAFRLVHKLMG